MALRHDLAHAVAEGKFNEREERVVRKILIESLPPRLTQALDAVRSLGSADYSDVAARLDVHRVHAARLLKELCDLGLLDRDESARPFVYFMKGKRND